MTKSGYLSVLAAGTLALTGCQSVNYRLYEGPERPADQVAHLEVPHVAQVVSVDSVKLNFAGRLATGETTTYTIDPGAHRLAVRYHEFWPIGEDDHETFSSDPVMLEGAFEAGSVYRVQLKRPQTLNEARAFEKAPVFTLIQASTVTPADHDKSKAVLKPSSLAPAKPVPVETKPPATPSASDGAALDNLKSSWQKATPAERKAFRKWIVDH